MSGSRARVVRQSSVVGLRLFGIVDGWFCALGRDNGDLTVGLTGPNAIRIHVHIMKQSCRKGCKCTAGWLDAYLAFEATLSRDH